MLGGPGNRVDDKPGWREKIQEWRDSPPWVLERPGWMTESPLVLGLLFIGIATLMLSFVYLAVPPKALPESLPGRYVLPARFRPGASTTTTTTTTTVPVRARLERQAKRREEVKSWSVEKQEQWWAWVSTYGEYKEQEQRAEELLSRPPEPKLRRFDLAFVSLAAAGGLLALAWFLSDWRARRQWSG